ncbi:MAG: hypothetical protein D6820_11840 [Lentisphaerae bacterium]|nr:MAG: hypothetical protein D6820_11840 [Lentisphaerota bacterium]
MTDNKPLGFDEDVDVMCEFDRSVKVNEPLKGPRGSRGRRGQAIAEFTWAMLAMGVLLAALFQIALLAKAGVETQGEARGEVESKIISWTAGSGDDRYISDWKDGTDQLAYTDDDKPVSLPGGDDLSTFSDNLQEPMDVNTLFNVTQLSAHNEFGLALSRASIVEAADLRDGKSSQSIPVEHILHALVLPKESSIKVETKIFMPNLLLLGKDETP